MRRVKWLRQALANLDQAAAFIAQDDPAAASRMVLRIEQAVAQLARHPDMGRPGRVASTRELVVPGTPYLIPYRVAGNDLEILRVLHGAQLWPPQ